MDLEAFGAIELADKDGTTVRLGDVYAARPAAFCFVRHFG